MTNSEIVYNVALSDGMPDTLAKLITAQANHETGGFTSSVFMDCNNAFGYNDTGISPCPGHFPYKSYNSLVDSTHEITAWINRRRNAGTFPNDLTTIQDAATYAALLQANGYFTDSLANYTQGLENWYVDNIESDGTIGLFLIAGFIFFLVYRKKR